MKTIQLKTTKDYLELAIKGVSHRHLCLAETERQAEEGESFIVGGKSEGYRCAPIGGCGRGEPGDGTEKGGLLCDRLGKLFSFLGSELSWKL